MKECCGSRHLELKARNSLFIIFWAAFITVLYSPLGSKGLPRFRREENIITEGQTPSFPTKEFPAVFKDTNRQKVMAPKDSLLMTSDPKNYIGECPDRTAEKRYSKIHLKTKSTQETVGNSMVASSNAESLPFENSENMLGTGETRHRRRALFFPRRSWNVVGNKNNRLPHAAQKLRSSRERTNLDNNTTRNGRRDEIGVKLKYKNNIDPKVLANISVQSGVNKVIEDKLINTLLEELERKFDGRNPSGTRATPTSDSTEMMHSSTNRKATESQPVTPEISPAYKCDAWMNDVETCLSERAIGDSITFSLAINGKRSLRHPFEVTWTKEYHIRFTNSTKTEVITADNPPWNMVVGLNGMELRVSPIVDTDIGANTFVANVWTVKISQLRKFKHLVKRIKYQIRIIPIDLGYVYVGEDIIIDFERYCTVPAESMVFEWIVESNDSLNGLPSNMKISRSGRSLHIKELRADQEGIISCSVYNDAGLFMTQRRFFVKEEDNVMLIELKEYNHTAEKNSQGKLLSRLTREAPRGNKSAENISTSTQSEEGWDIGTITSMILGQSDYHAHKGYSNTFSNDRIPLISTNLVSSKPVDALHGPHEFEYRLEAKDFYSSPKRLMLKKMKNKKTNALESTLLLFSSNPDLEAIKVDIKESFIVSDCINDRQCSPHALCVQPYPNYSGHCRCFDGYRGNGIFCWESVNYVPRPQEPVHQQRIFDDYEDDETQSYSDQPSLNSDLDPNGERVGVISNELLENDGDIRADEPLKKSTGQFLQHRTLSGINQRYVDLSTFGIQQSVAHDLITKSTTEMDENDKYFQVFEER